MDDFAIDEIDILDGDGTENLLVDEIFDLPVDEAEKRIGSETSKDVGFEPHEGMEFSSKQAAYDFYNAYGYVLGFSIRVNSSYKNAQGTITSMRFVCNKQGFNKQQKSQLEEPFESGERPNSGTPEKSVPERRTGCKASFHVRLHKDGIWKVTGFHKDHNHEFVANTPSKKRHLRSHKTITLEERADIKLLSEQNVGATQIREYLAAKAGGKANLHYGKKDVNNQISKENRSLVGVDVNAMVDYFIRRQQDDPEFFFAVEPDKDNAAKNIFWVDGRSRRAYEELGDVITFDTTYNTNQYSMPMAPFLGVSPHRHSIFFGCALIRDEQKTTFFWLFQTWLDAMGGKKPKTFFTDQCPSMKAAVEKIFGSDTVHRCCLWHIMKNFKDHLGVLYGVVPGFKDELRAVINFSLTVADFDKNWKDMLKKYKMQDNPHLTLMYDKRDTWAPAYFRGAFCAGMSTTQRSESMNAVTKIWMGSNTSLYNFAKKFDKMVEGTYEKESDEDIRTMNEKAQLWSCDPIEEEARKVYTRNVFSLFKEKLKKASGYRVHEVEKDKCYEVRPAVNHIKYEWYNPIRIVVIDKKNGTAECECKGFEYQGILCPHALEVMRHVGMEPFLPSHYILRRWTPDANASIKRAVSNKTMEGNRCELDSIMLHALNQLMQEVAEEAVKSRPAIEKARTRLVELKDEVTEINQGINLESVLLEKEDNDLDTMNAPCEARKSLKFGDPPVSQCKGKRKPQRLKHPSEVKNAKKMRTCSYCHKKEGHNMATCPKKLKDGKAKKVQAYRFEEDEDVETDSDTEDDEY